MPRLRKYRYEFEWKHGETASAITSIRVLRPIKDEMVSHTSGPSVVVYGMQTDEPFVRMGNMPLQQLQAVTDEVLRVRKEMLQDA